METRELNIEEQLKCYKLLLEGKYELVEFRYYPDPIWYPCYKHDDRLYHGNAQLRLKPLSRYRPWKVEEVPLGAWIRYKDSGHDSHAALITDTFVDELTAGRAVRESYQRALSIMEYSLDQGKTWNVCGVLEQ